MQDSNDEKFDFIISINSKEAIIKSLKSYGLELKEKEKEVDIDYINLKYEK